jgi:hypothetical protein
MTDDSSPNIDELVKQAQAAAQRRHDVGVRYQDTNRALPARPRNLENRIAKRRSIAKASRNQQRRATKNTRKARTRARARRGVL